MTEGLNHLRKHSDQFLRFLGTIKQYSPHTISNYKRDIYHFIHFFPQVAVSHVRYVMYDHAQEYVLSLLNYPYSRRSIARKIAALRSFWRYLLTHHHCVENPWTQLSLPKQPSTLPSVLSTDKVILFLESIPTESKQGCRNRLVFEFLFSTGLRVSELVNMDLTHISISERECRVIGKGNKERIVFFGETVTHWLNRYLTEVRPQWIKDSEQAVFISQKGTRLSVRSVQRDLKRYINMGFSNQDVTPHTIRHSFATALLNNGANLREIQELLGHSSLSSTQIYTHLSTDKLIKSYNKAHPRSE